MAEVGANYILETPEMYDVRSAGQELADKQSKISTLDNINQKAGKLGATVEEVASKRSGSTMGGVVRSIGSAIGTEVSGIAGAASRMLGPLGTLLAAITPSDLGGAEEDRKIGAMSNSYMPQQKAESAAISASNTAMADAVQPQPDPMEMLQLSASAQANTDIARSKIKDGNTEVGTRGNQYSYVLQPGDKVLRTFGGTTVKRQDGEVVKMDESGNITGGTIPAALRLPAIDEKQIVTNKIEGNASNTGFNITKEFESLRSLSGDDRFDRGNQLLVNIGMQVAKEQEKIRGIAAQQAGVNDAQAAYQNFTRLAAQMRPGQRVIEVEESRKSMNEAMILANKIEADMIAGNPELRKLKEYHDAITKDMTVNFQREGRKTAAQERQAEKDKDLVVITPERMVNGRYAIGIKKPANAGEEQATRRAIFDAAKGDKRLEAVLDMDKTSAVQFLTHPDLKIRQYAFKILQGSEREYQEVPPGAPDPVNVTAVEGLVSNPDEWIKKNSGLLPKEMLKRFKEEGQLAKGEKDIAEKKQNHRAEAVNFILDKQFRASYDQMQKWNYTDPSVKKVIESAFRTSGSKNVSMEDGITAIVNSEMRTPDGRIMTTEDKKAALLGSLEITLGNDRKSYLKPSADNYGPEFRDKVTNMFNRAFIRKRGSAVDEAAGFFNPPTIQGIR